MRLAKIFTALFMLAGLMRPVSAASAVPTVKVAVLKFGTVNWELNVIKHHKLDERAGINLEIIALASTQATKIALQAGAADIAVTDWLWVSRQRAMGGRFSFLPYSTALGAVMVPAKSAIRTLSDLKGKTLGIAGGPLDKSWLMLRAFAIKSGVGDLAGLVKPAYGAPPLLAAKLRQGELDAVLNFWHYSAKLEASGFKRLIGMSDVVVSLGAKGGVPMIGYTFRQSWAQTNAAAIKGFAKAIAAAKAIMAKSDEEWERLKPLTRTKTQKTLISLRDRFRDGIPARGDIASMERNSAILYKVLAKIGGKKLVGSADHLSAGTFWRAKPDAVLPKPEPK